MTIRNSQESFVMLPNHSKKDEVEIIVRPNIFADKRSEARAKANGQGQLITMSKLEKLDCRIVDQSPSGARVGCETLLKPASPIWFLHKNSNTIRQGSVVWARNREMGLKFELVLHITQPEIGHPKVPKTIFDHWLALNQLGLPVVAKPAPPPSTENDFFLD